MVPWGRQEVQSSGNVPGARRGIRGAMKFRKDWFLSWFLSGSMASSRLTPKFTSARDFQVLEERYWE
jgi:hypothetical protein